MAVYFCAYALMGALFAFGSKFLKDRQKKQIIFTASCFAIVFLMFALRHPSMGIDVRYGQSDGYLWSFKNITGKSWWEVITMPKFKNYEKGYVILNKFIGSINNSWQFFLGSVAFLATSPIYLVIYQKSKSPMLSAIIYMGLPAFMLSFSGLRQAIAMGICFLALAFIDRIKPMNIIVFVSLVLLAMTFHITAGLFLIAFPLYHIKLNKIARWISCGVPVILFVLAKPILTVALGLVNKQHQMQYTGAMGLFLIYMAIYVFCCIFAKEEHQGFVNIFFVACCVQALCMWHPYLARLGYYFTLVLVLLLPQIFDTVQNKYLRIIFNVGCAVFFVCFGLRALYNTGWAMSNPYRFFWR